MELLIIGALAYAGKKINEKDDEEQSVSVKPKCSTKKKKSNIKKNMYKFKKKVENKKAVKEKIYQNHKAALNPSKTNYISRNNVKQENNINKSNDSFTEQFNVLKFDAQQPTSFNSFGQNDENYSSFNSNHQDMTYNIIKNNDNFLHNNMQPGTSQRDFPLQTNEGVMKNRLELFTGFPEDFKAKKESKPLFEPMQDLSFVNGMPVATDYLEQRYIPSYKKNDQDLPFENKVKVIPGIEGQNQEGIYGTYRVLPKTTDDLRAANNPKMTYQAGKIEAVKKGEYRGTNPNVQSYKPLTYKVNKKDELLPTYAHVRAQTIRNKIQMPNTNRQQSIYHTGPAKSSDNVATPDQMRAKYRENTKIEYASDAISRNVTSNVNKILQNKNAMKLAPTRKQVTSDKSIHGGVGNASANKAYSINRKDIPLTTLRQLMIENKNIMGVTDTNNKGYVFSKDFVLPTTGKETLVENDRDGNIRQVGGGHAYNPNDLAKETTKELFVGDVRDGNMTGRDGGYVYDPNHLAKETIKQTVIGQSRDGNMTGRDGGYVYDPNHLAKDTIKQSVIGQARDGNITGGEKGYVYDPNDIAKDTIKQSIIGQARDGNINGGEKGYVYDPNDIAKDTIKQTVIGQARDGNIKGGDRGYVYDPNDLAKDTIKQTVIGQARDGNMTGREKGYVYDPNDKPLETIKEMFVDKTRDGNVKKIGGTYSHNSNDTARKTIKEMQIHNNHTGVTTVSNKDIYVRNPNEIANRTIKETTVENNHVGGAADNTQGTYSHNPNEIAKRTIKEMFIDNKHVGTAHGTEASYAEPTDQAKQTIKETTHASYSGGIAMPTDRNTGYQTNNIIAPTTIRETTHSSYSGAPAKPDADGYLSNKMVAPETCRQNTHVDYKGTALSQDKKQKITDDFINMNTNEKREILSQGRIPTQRKHDEGPKAENVNMELKEFINSVRNNNPIQPLNKNAGDNLSSIYSRNKNLLSNTNYNLDPSILSVLHKNPYVNNVIFNKNVDPNNPYYAKKPQQ